MNGVPFLEVTMLKGVRRHLFLTAVVIFLIGGSPIFGQMTVINTPTTDTLEKGRFYFEADVIFKPKKI